MPAKLKIGDSIVIGTYYLADDIWDYWINSTVILLPVSVRIGHWFHSEEEAIVAAQKVLRDFLLGELETTRIREKTMRDILSQKPESMESK